MLSQAHQTHLGSHYGIDATKCPQLSSVNADEIRELFGRSEVEGGGILITYNPQAPLAEQIFRVRLDLPLVDAKTGRKIRYLSPPGQKNALFIPDGQTLDVERIIMTEGELKSLAAFQRGLPVLALPGIYGWKSGSDIEGIKLSDAESLISELQRDWSSQDVDLLYDSDIDSAHEGWPAFQRLAEQLYARGARKVRITTLPKLPGSDGGESGKTGLDDFLLAMERQGKDGKDETLWWLDRAPLYFPSGDGVQKFCEFRMRIDANRDERMEAFTVLFKNDPLQFELAVEQEVRGEPKRRALRREVKSRHEKVLQIQQPQAERRLRPPADAIYTPYVQGLADTDYALAEPGHLYRVIEYNGRNRLQKLANFVLRVSREIRLDLGTPDSNETFVEVEGLRENGIVLAPRRIRLSEFSAGSSLANFFGAKLILEPIPLVERYIVHAAKLLGIQAPIETKYGHTGWREIGNKWAYLHADGAIGADNVDVLLGEPGSSTMLYRLPADPGDVKAAAQRSLSFLEVAPRNITLPMLMFVYLATLMELFRQAGYPVGFSAYVSGSSGSQKSSAVAALMCHLGAFTRKDLGSFSSTANSLERQGFVLKDSVMVVDDWYPTDNSREQDEMASKLNRMARVVSNGSGRGRCNPDGSLKAVYPQRGLAIFTMEMTVRGQSTLARGLELVFRKGMVDLARLSELQDNAHELAQAMRGFLEWVCENFTGFVNRIKSEFPKERTAFRAESLHDQIPEHLAALMIALELMGDYFHTVGALDEEGRTALLQEGRAIFQSLGVHQSAQVKEESPIEVMDKILEELFATGAVHLKGVSGEAPPRANQVGWRTIDEDSVLPERSLCIGYADSERMYLLPEVFFEKLVQFKARQGQRFPVNQKALLRQLKDCGRLETYTEGTHETFRKNLIFEGARRKVVVIRRNDGGEEATGSD